jgi:ligand-binding sensor domain-containing protein
MTRRAALAALCALASVSAAGPDGAAAATRLYIRNHVNSNDVRGLASWGGVLAAATTGGLVTVAMSSGPPTPLTPLKTLAAPGGLPTNQTLSVAVSPSGDLWIGTVDGGVARLSPGGGWRRALTTFDGLPSDRVQTLLPAGDSVWVGTSGGVALFAENRSSARVTLRRSDSSASTAGGLVSDDVRALAIVGDTLWVGTGSGLSSFQSGVWLDRRSVFAGPVNALAVVGDTLWVGTTAGPRAYAGGVLAPVAAGHFGSTLALAEAGGALYSATNGPGVFRRAAGSWVATGPGLPLGNKNALGTAPDGALWAGSETGMARYDAAADAWTVYRTEGPAVNDLQKTTVRDAEAWFTPGNVSAPGQGAGVVLWTDGVSWDAVTSVGTGGALQAASTFGILAAREGHLWFGHCCGAGPPPPRVDRYDPAADAWLAPGGSNVLAFGQAPSGRIYAASDRSGVYVYESPSGALIDSLTSANTSGSAVGSLLNQDVRGASFDPAGVGWFATANGVFRWNGLGTDDHSDDRWTLFTTGLPSSNTTSVLALDTARVYIGTESGIAVLTGSFIDIERKNAITAVIGSVSVRGLARDPRGIVWMATAAGLARFDDATLQMENFTMTDGLVDDEVRGVAWDEARGVLWVATAHGVSEVHPQGSGTPAFGASAFAYPNPAGPGATALRIGGLLGAATGEIRDVTGRLVRNFRADPVSNTIWDLRDASGAKAAPGLYLIVLRDGDRVRILRAAVTR